MCIVYMMLKCGSCGEILPEDEFYVDATKYGINHSDKRNNRDYTCKVCRIIEAKERVEKKRLTAINILTNSKNKCRCGYSNTMALAIDHINNDGAIDRHITKLNGARLYKWIIDNPEEAKKKLQVLCWNCNHIKHLKFMASLPFRKRLIQNNLKERRLK